MLAWLQHGFEIVIKKLDLYGPIYLRMRGCFMAASLQVSNVSKTFSGKPVLNTVSFAAKKGEFIVLVGPSGCGKSTMLRSVAGLESIDSGQIIIGEEDVSELAPKNRDIAMVFQDYALYPHKTVYENIAFGLRIRKMPKHEIDQRVQAAATKLDLLPYLKRKPAQLSGGQRQRVAIGRAIVRKPKVFLFDEPLSNLDAKLRGSMRLTISRLHKDLGATIVYVTHDQVEAMTLADKIVVLNGGDIQQMGSPLDLYYHPKNAFVATFIGSPPMNMIAGTIEPKDNGSVTFKSDKGFEYNFGEKFVNMLKTRPNTRRRVTWGIRPENLSLWDPSIESKFTIEANVIVRELLGPSTSVYCTVGGHEINVMLDGNARPERGEKIKLAHTSSHLYLFDEETGLSLVDR